MSQDCYKKLALGTVQFGLDYGISNRSGKTPSTEVDGILKLAHQLGINVLDTAHMYGESEAVIGALLSSRNYSIVTKTPHFTSQRITGTDVELLLSTFNDSCEKLHQSPYGLMIHDGNDLLKPGGEKLYLSMQSLKSQGFVNKIGVSVYTPEQCKCIFDKFDFDLIQLPMNIYDQRFLATGILDYLTHRKVEVHIRSIFLQGLILMPALPGKFHKLNSMHECFYQFCDSINQSPLKVAYMFVANLPQVDKIVVGVNTVNQLEDITKGNCFNISTEMIEKFAIDDETIINPTKWN